MQQKSQHHHANKNELYDSISTVVNTLLTQLTSRFFSTVLPRAGIKHPPVKDELFDAFAVDNYIEKYCRYKQ